MVKEEKQQPPSYTFTVISKIKPEFSRVLISSSPLASCYALGLFTEQSHIGVVNCIKTFGSLRTTALVSNLFYSDSLLYINTNEKLRPEAALFFIEFLISEKLIGGELIILDSICEQEFIGKPLSRVRSVYSTAWNKNNECNLEPGNSLKGVSAAGIIASQAHGIKASCFVAVPESYELCEENAGLFVHAPHGLSYSNIGRGISKYEQEKYKHQIYS